MMKTNLDLKALRHRLEIIDGGQFHCLLCNMVGFWEEIEPHGECKAPEEDREEFDTRYSLPE